MRVNVELGELGGLDCKKMTLGWMGVKPLRNSIFIL